MTERGDARAGAPDPGGHPRRGVPDQLHRRVPRRDGRALPRRCCATSRRSRSSNLVVFAYEREPETPSLRDDAAGADTGSAVPPGEAAGARSRRCRVSGSPRRIGETLTVASVAPVDRHGRRVQLGCACGRFGMGSGWWRGGGGRQACRSGQLATVRVTGAAAYDLFARAERPADPALNILRLKEDDNGCDRMLAGRSRGAAVGLRAHARCGGQEVPLLERPQTGRGLHARGGQLVPGTGREQPRAARCRTRTSR